MKESNKDRTLRLAKEAEKAKRLEALDNLARDAQEQGLYDDFKPKAIADLAAMNKDIDRANVKWIVGGVTIGVLLLLLIL